MESKRVLIVEPDSEFALSLASVFRDDGYGTRIAASAAEAELEIASRRPDLCVVRAELGDLSGFSLCAQLRHDPVTARLPVVLYSSDTPPEALADHARTPWAANGYLAMPLDTDALRTLVARILAASDAVESADDAVIEEVAEDGGADADEGADDGREDREAEAPEGRVEAAGPAPGSPPPMPRRPRRATLTDEDRLFADRVFQSISEHRDELLSESYRRRPPPRRDLLTTPEGRAQVLRDDLRWREAQLARLAEVWEVRERELSSFDERMHDKDVELQGLKGQVEDLLRRLTDARDAFVRKERELGASIDGLLLEKFGQEKELIEVIAANERRIHELERELRRRDDDLAHRKIALSEAQDEIARQDRNLRSETARFEERERELAEALARRTEEHAATERALADAREGAAAAEREARARQEASAARQQTLEAERDAIRDERDAALREREETAEAARREADQDRDALRARLAEAAGRGEAAAGELAEAQAKLGALGEELARAAEARAVLEDEVRQARAEAHAYDEKAVAAEHGWQAKAAELEAATQRIADLAAALDEGRATAEGARGDLQRLDAVRADAERRAAHVAAERDQAARELEKARRAAEAARAEIATERERFARLEGEVQRLARLEPVAEEAVRLKKEVASLREMVQQRTTSAESASRSAQAAAAERARAEERLAVEGGKLQAQAARLETELGTARRRVEELERAAGAREATLRKTASEAEERRRAQASEVGDVERKHAAEATRLRAAMVDLEKHLEARARSELQLKKRVQELERAAQAARPPPLADAGDAAKLKARLDKLAEEVEDLRSENDFLNGEVARYQQKNKDLTAQLAARGQA